MTPYAEVIGDPIVQSKSPIVQGYWLEALGIEGQYRRHRVSQAELASYIADRRADPAWRGSNVTMPLKLDALDQADEASDRAVAAGAANLLLPRDGRIFAANTDVHAVQTLIERHAPLTSVTVLGNGGAARAALVALRLAGIGNVRIAARDLGAARKLCVQFHLDQPPVALTEAIESQGLINATPLGMAGRDALHCDLGRMPTDGFVFDMVSVPAVTPLIAAARARGLRSVTGLDMLVEQAATSFKLMFGAEAPRDRDPGLWQRLSE